jgi:ubiquinone/menaquinone biosynthesis C-methylase UbiE
MEYHNGDGRKMKKETGATPFNDYQHALDFDQRAADSDIRGRLAVHLIEAMGLNGDERILDIATGTGRFARIVSTSLTGGTIVGVDGARAMLRVARENMEMEPIHGYSQSAGMAESMPFRSAAFDRAFVAFSLHHFGDPGLMVQEAYRVLKPGGRFFVLDPVVLQPRDSLDQSLNELVNRVFRRSHGADFRFCSAEDVRSHLTKAGFQIAMAALHRYSFDQAGMEGIPTGRHWLEVAEEAEIESEQLKKRLEENYLQVRKSGESAHVKGTFSYALVCGEKS